VQYRASQILAKNEKNQPPGQPVGQAKRKPVNLKKVDKLKEEDRALQHVLDYKERLHAELELTAFIDAQERKPDAARASMGRRR
jgi:hypothetical protein